MKEAEEEADSKFAEALSKDDEEKRKAERTAAQQEEEEKQQERLEQEAEGEELEESPEGESTAEVPKSYEEFREHIHDISNMLGPALKAEAKKLGVKIKRGDKLRDVYDSVQYKYIQISREHLVSQQSLVNIAAEFPYKDK